MSEYLHARCGGVLADEWHDKLVTRNPNRPGDVMVTGKELLVRCQKCRMVGVLGPETNNPSVNVEGLLKVAP